MLLEIFIRYLHFASLFAMISAIVSEHLLLKPQMTRKEIGRMAVLDGIYGISALVVVAAGLTLWFGVGKPAEFYTKNWVFHLKLTLVVIAGLISIYPTIFFLKHRKGGTPEELVTLPNAIKMVIRLELLLFFIIPLLAVLMARGIGKF